MIPHKDKMQTGACILWRGKSVAHKVMQLWTDLTHASLIIRLDKYDLLKDKVFLIEAYEHGLEFNDLEEQMEGKDDDVYLFVPSELSRWNKITIFKDAFNFLAKDKGYDYFGLVYSAVAHPERNPERFFCSEFVDYIWTISGLKRKEPGRYAPWPGDIPKWWEGQLYTIREEK